MGLPPALAVEIGLLEPLETGPHAQQILFRLPEALSDAAALVFPEKKLRQGRLPRARIGVPRAPRVLGEQAGKRRPGGPVVLERIQGIGLENTESIERLARRGILRELLSDPQVEVLSRPWPAFTRQALRLAERASGGRRWGGNCNCWA